MANNQQNTTRRRTTKRQWTKTDVANFCSLWAVIIAGIIMLINAILKLVKASISTQLFTSIATLLLVIAVAITGYNGTRGKPRIIRIIFFIALAVIIVCGALTIN